MEGTPLSTGGDDTGDYRVKVAEDFGGGNAKGGEADPGEALIADYVTFGPVAAVVKFTVDFDRQTRFETREVEAVADLRILAAEAKAARFAAQLLPRKHLGLA